MASRRTSKPEGRTTPRYARRDSKNGRWRAKRSDTARRPGQYTFIPTRRSGSAVIERSSQQAPPLPILPVDDVVIHEHGVLISGSRQAMEDYVDGREIYRRLADPDNQRRVPWAEVKARRGL